MKNNYPYLTAKEYELMKIFWLNDRPLSNKDILELSDNRTWSVNSLHPILNKLIDKDFIKVVGKIKATKVNARLFSANVTIEEYTANQISDILGKDNGSFRVSKFLSAFANYSNIEPKDTENDVEK